MESVGSELESNRALEAVLKPLKKSLKAMKPLKEMVRELSGLERRQCL